MVALSAACEHDLDDNQTPTSHTNEDELRTPKQQGDEEGGSQSPPGESRLARSHRGQLGVDDECFFFHFDDKQEQMKNTIEEKMQCL